VPGWEDSSLGHACAAPRLEGSFRHVGTIKTGIEVMLELVAWYRERNVPLVLITAQNDVLAEPYARVLGFDHMIANHFEEENGSFTGAVTMPYNFQEGKVHWAKRYLDEKKLSFADCAFYSDSIHDAPLLSRVAFPVAVNPDKRLMALAVEKGWKTVNFKGEMARL